MNWIDGVLIVLLLSSVIVGSKKGLIRELMAFAVFFAAIIASVNYIDVIAVWVYDSVGGSPLVSAFLSFIICLAVSYAVFKLLGILFYKIASIKEVKRRDQMGGALIGFLRGWTAVGFLTFLVFLLPMPASFYDQFESSLFGPTVAKTLPLIYEGTAAVHPGNPNFLNQVEEALLFGPAGGRVGQEMLTEDRQKVHEVLRLIEKNFIITDATI